MAGISGIALTGSDPVKLFSLTFSGVATPSMSPILRSGVIGQADIVPSELLQTIDISSENGLLDFSSNDGSYDILDEIYVDASSAIDSRDALMVLQIANQSLTIDDLLSPLQVMAADINKSGEVSALDAWLLLKYIVGQSVSNIGQVGLVDSDQDLSAIDSTNAFVDDQVSVDAGQVNDYIAYVIGDVDGSLLVMG
jgi:hypothetical protein